MTGDTALYLALRCRRGDVDAAIRARGVPLFVDAELPAPVFEAGAIFVRPDSSDFERAHELGHAVLWENTSDGIEYAPEDFLQRTEEAVCDGFAAALLGEG